MVFEKIAALQLNNPGGNSAVVVGSTENIIAKFLDTWVLWGISVAATGFILYAGIQFMMSQGDSSKVQKARNTLLYAVAGVILAVLAFAIINFFNAELNKL